MLNMDLVVVNMAAMEIYSFVNADETNEQAEKRANSYYIKHLDEVKAIYNKRGGEYWAKRIDEAIATVNCGCRVMTFDEYQKLQREHLLSGDLKEITEKEYQDALEMLPPIFWCNKGNVEMFCISEMYTGTYTNQYAHDKRTDKYYTKLVDSADRSTWIYELLNE